MKTPRPGFERPAGENVKAEFVLMNFRIFRKNGSPVQYRSDHQIRSLSSGAMYIGVPSVTDG